MTDEEFLRIERDYNLGRALYAHIPLLIAEIKRLQHLLKSADELIEDLERGVEVLDAIPGCPVHGQGCAPWALEWIAKMRYATAADAVPVTALASAPAAAVPESAADA